MTKERLKYYIVGFLFLVNVYSINISSFYSRFIVPTFLLTIFLLSFFRVLKERVLKFTFFQFEYIILLFIIYMIINILFRDFQYLNLVYILRLIIIFSTYILIRFSFYRGKTNGVLIFSKLFLLFLLISTYFYLYIFKKNYIGLNLTVGSELGKNSLAFLVAAIFPVVVTKTKSRFWRIIYFLVYLGISYYIQSRALLVIMFIYLLFYLIYYLKNLTKKSGFQTRNWIFISLILLLVLITTIVLSDTYWFDLNGESFYDRVNLIKYSMQLFYDYPVFGVGFGNYISIGESIELISHNDYLLILSEGGIIGLSLFLAYVFSLSKQLFFELKIDKSLVPYVISVLGIHIYMLFINVLFSLLYWFIMGLLISELKKKHY